MLNRLSLVVPIGGFAIIGCVPPADDMRIGTDRGTTLAVAIEAPLANASVATGSDVQIRWSAVNNSGDAGVVTIFVESRSTLEIANIVSGFAVDGTQPTQSAVWTTAGFAAGEYAVKARIVAGSRQSENAAPGRITIDAPATFTFTAPVSQITLEAGETVDITWNGFDPEGSGRLRLNVDLDDNPANGNEILIAERALADVATEEMFEWNGTDQDGDAVAQGTYRVVAVINDDVNPEQRITAPGRIVVPQQDDDNDNDNDNVGVSEPAEDATFLATDDPLPIVLNVRRSADALVDVKIDTDDNHANGNEITIFSQRFIEAGTEMDELEWDGTDAGGVAVEDGIYRIVIVSSTGEGAPQSIESESLVFRRATENKPLIALLAPAAVQTLTPGGFLNVQWRDDDPAGNARIRIALDDDNMPAEPVETGDPEITILADRAAEPDGVQDSFTFQIPNTLAPGTYFVFAFIDSNPNDLAADHVSVAGAPVIIRDPADPDR